jgi:hypothetical protein
VNRYIDKHGVSLIAIGNGTASRETEQFIAEVIQNAQGDRSRMKPQLSDYQRRRERLFIPRQPWRVKSSPIWMPLSAAISPSHAGRRIRWPNW